MAQTGQRFRVYLIDANDRILVRHEVSAETLANAIETGFDFVRAVRGSRSGMGVEIWSGTQRLFHGSPNQESAQTNNPTHVKNTERWELCAEEVRVLAEAMNSPDAKRAMQDIAESYQRMAQHVAGRHTA